MFGSKDNRWDRNKSDQWNRAANIDRQERARARARNTARDLRMGGTSHNSNAEHWRNQGKKGWF